MLDPARLGPMLKDRRASEGWSLRQAATEIGVSFTTISRVESGHIPDFETYQRLSAFLGFPGSEGVEVPEPTSSTLDEITLHLQRDPYLTDEDAERIAHLVRSMYEALARPSPMQAVHLRSARTFKPVAARLLGELLDDMRRGLEGDAAS